MPLSTTTIKTFDLGLGNNYLCALLYVFVCVYKRESAYFVIAFYAFNNYNKNSLLFRIDLLMSHSAGTWTGYKMAAEWECVKSACFLNPCGARPHKYIYIPVY